MSLATLTLSDVYVSKGYDGKPAATFTANDKSDYGVLHFRVSRKKYAKKGETAQYDNYTVEWRNVKSDSKMIEFLNQPGTVVSLTGELTQEVYKENKFCKISCDSRNAVSIATFGEKKDDTVAPSAPADNSDAL